MPGSFFLASGDDAEHVAAEFGVGEAFPHRVELAGGVGHGLVAEKAGVLQASDSAPAVGPRHARGRRRDPGRLGVPAMRWKAMRYSAGWSRTRPSDDLGADRDEVGGGIVGLGQLVDVRRRATRTRSGRAPRRGRPSTRRRCRRHGSWSPPRRPRSAPRARPARRRRPAVPPRRGAALGCCRRALWAAPRLTR